MRSNLLNKINVNSPSVKLVKDRRLKFDKNGNSIQTLPHVVDQIPVLYWSLLERHCHLQKICNFREVVRLWTGPPPFFCVHVNTSKACLEALVPLENKICGSKEFLCYLFDPPKDFLNIKKVRNSALLCLIISCDWIKILQFDGVNHVLFLGKWNVVHIKIHFLITKFKYCDESCGQNEGGTLYLTKPVLWLYPNSDKNRSYRDQDK